MDARSVPFYVSSALSVLGVAVSAYLLDAQSVLRQCEVGSVFWCAGVLDSEYSVFMGLPVASYGLGWFAAALVLSVLSLRVGWSATYLLAWSVVGVVGVAILVYTEFVIGSFCVFCTVAHILGVGILATSYWGYREREPS